MNASIPYRVFFERTFSPIALYQVERRCCSGKDCAKWIRYIDVNGAYEKVMKVERKDVIGRTFAEVWPNVESCWTDIIQKCLATGRTSHCEGECSNIHTYLEAIAFPLPHDRVAVIFLDRTDRKKAYDALKRKQETLLLYRKELRALAAKLTLSEEDTRRAIATDLHDRIGYALVSLLNRFRELRQSNSLEEIQRGIEEAIAETELLISESRELIFELSPPILKEVGLNPALESLADNLLTPLGIQWKFKSRGNRENFNADDAICVLLYRMTRELLINVIKHAKATSVSIHVHRGPGKIQVVVEDDGRGFPADFTMKQDAGRAFGLFSIRERLVPIGGDLKILSEPGKGSTIAMTAPLDLIEESLRP